MKKCMRKGAIVKYTGNNKNFTDTWGDYFEVYCKEGNFLKVVSLKKPGFGVVAALPCNVCRLANN